MQLSVTLSACLAMLSGHAVAQEMVLEEVIVTAQKREQDIREVPVAVTALGQADFERFDIGDVLDVSMMSPFVNFTPQQSKMSNNPLRIRGVGSSGTNPAFEGSVGVYVDAPGPPPVVM